MIEFVRQKAPTLNPTITVDMMEKKSDTEILDRIAAVFRNISGEARKASRAGEEGDDESDKKMEEARANRHKTRKVRVSLNLLTLPLPLN